MNAPTRWNSRLAGVVVFISTAFILIALAFFYSGDRDFLKAAAKSLEQRDYRQAEQLCQKELAQHPDSIPALTLAAAAAEKGGRKGAALGYLESIPDDGAAANIDTAFRCGELAIETGRLSAAESHFRRVVAADPNHHSASHRLCFLLRIEGRNWEAQEFLKSLADAGELGFDELFLLGTTEWVWLDAREASYLDYCRSSVANDPLPMLGRIRQGLLREELHSAGAHLRHLVNLVPSLVEPQARLGILHAQESTREEFLDWHRRLPSDAERHPGIWFARGLWMAKQGHHQQSIRCFGEAVRRDSNHRGACYQLSQLLQRESMHEGSGAFAHRSKLLARVEDLLREVQQSPFMMKELVDVMLDLGRDQEAQQWLKFAAIKLSEQPWMNVARERILEPHKSGAIMASESSPTFHDIDWSNWPLPDWQRIESPIPSSSESGPSAKGNPISFSDVASRAGINFHYDNGASASSGRSFMFEFSGGGVAVLDFDGDGWADIYLTQGGGWPSNSAHKRYSDKVFRNAGNGHFVDVTIATGLDNAGFGQGATVGDFDNDGFPDLYLTNIGTNRFYRNLGDGTFVQIEIESATDGQAWSLGGALADLNGDALPDLYVVNYLGGPDVFVRSCHSKGRPIQCPPGGFAAEQDRMYLNLGDGHFRDITKESGIDVADGKGMGIIVADFDQSTRAQIFIANDTTANFLFSREGNGPSAIPIFAEHGALLGVAYSDTGNARSSMGIACGDVNDDGLLDLLVTNYIRESNSLMLQRDDHSFEDHTRAAGLRQSSLDKMGWGTQFLDADLDGMLDLVVANGHLDDYSADGVPYKMSTQVFRNQGHARFEELSSKQLGTYFARQVLGRSVARLDWNRDGREDFCVTHVDVPFALLSNVTEPCGHSLTLSFRGVDSSRDAIGTTIKIQVGNRTLVRQLVAGDGFEASNERKIVVGLGVSNQADAVTVRWPSGKEQQYLGLAAGSEWICIEGSSKPIPLNPE